MAQESVADRIAALPAVKDVQELESTKFPEKYLVIFEQPIDHEDLTKGTFTQRVVVGIVHPDSATVVVTEGYGAQYAFVPSYRDEISTIFNTNNIVVEHRYFLESTPYPGEAPEEVNWDYMNAPNAAADIHEVVTALKTIFDGKWISTGISKGGQNTMIYRTYYPDDVDFSVPYVGPLCRALYDGRHEPFIETYAGTPEDREAIKNFQIALLLRKDRLMPAYDSVCVAREYEFNAPVDEIYDFGVLEFSFAFWQWGYPVEQIPGKDASDKEVFDYLMAICPLRTGRQRAGILRLRHEAFQGVQEVFQHQEHQELSAETDAAPGRGPGIQRLPVLQDFRIPALDRCKDAVHLRTV